MHMCICILLVQCLTARIILFLLRNSEKEQEAACSYLALEFAPVNSRCLARVDLHSVCMGEHQAKPKFPKRARQVV